MPESRRVSRVWVLRRRLATQRLSARTCPSVVDAVRPLTYMQTQDAPSPKVIAGMAARHRQLELVGAVQARKHRRPV